MAAVPRSAASGPWGFRLSSLGMAAVPGVRMKDPWHGNVPVCKQCSDQLNVPWCYTALHFDIFIDDLVEFESLGSALEVASMLSLNSLQLRHQLPG